LGFGGAPGREDPVPASGSGPRREFGLRLFALDTKTPRVKPAQLAQFLVVGLAALGVYSFARTARDGEMRRVCTPLCGLSPDYAGRNRTVPDFQLPDLGGRTVRFSSLRGKVVILNFWTKTCGPCLQEMPSLAELGKVLKARPEIALVTISIDESADDIRGTLKSVLKTDDPPFVVLVDPESSVVHDLFGTRLFPETWFIDPSGVIRARVDGGRNWDGSVPLDFAESIRDPLACDIEFTHARPVGDLAGLCADVTPQQ
jgi:thiol-disulfide isomerase/thioredoxin